MHQVTEQTESSLVKPVPEIAVDSFFRFLRDRRITEALELFAEKFTFHDNALSLTFNHKQQLTEFFEKQAQLYPDYLLNVEMQFSQGDNVSLLWVLTASISQTVFGGNIRTAPITVRGASFIRVHDGRIVEWSDYYDELTSRRTTLAEYFRVWIEY